MAQKSSPYAIRVGYNTEWNDNFFPDNKTQIPTLLINRIIRSSIIEKIPNVSQVKITHLSSNILVFVFVAIEKKEASWKKQRKDSVLSNEKVEGQDLKKILETIEKKLAAKKTLNYKKIDINVIYQGIFEHADSLINYISERLKNRESFRWMFKDLTKLIEENKRFIKGLKIIVNGRIDGAEIARSETINFGKMPLSTIDSNIEFSKKEVTTTYGQIGIRVWMFKGKKTSITLVNKTRNNNKEEKEKRKF